MVASKARCFCYCRDRGLRAPLFYLSPICHLWVGWREAPSGVLPPIEEMKSRNEPAMTRSTVSAGVVSPSLGRHVPRYPPGSNVFEGPQISLKKRRDEHVFTRHHQGVRVPAPGTTVIGFGMTGFSWPSTYSWFRLNTLALPPPTSRAGGRIKRRLLGLGEDLRFI